MRIVTNPGSNLPDELLREYAIELAPQKISVDGIEHDTRKGVTLEQVDLWVKTAKVYPFVLGSSAAECVEVFRRVGKDEREVVAIMSSRKIVGTYTAAVSASRVLQGKVDVRVIDSGCTDIGAGLPTLLAAQAARSGRSLREVETLVERFCRDASMILVPDTLDWFVKSGRATAMKAFFANLLSLRPIIQFQDGELRSSGSVKHDEATIIDALVQKTIERIGAGRPIWLGVSHTRMPERAARLEAAARKRFDVRYCMNRELHASIYHSAGPGAVMIYAAPCDELPAGLVPVGG